MTDYLSSVEYSLTELNQQLRSPAIESFMFFVIVVSYTIFLFNVESKYRKLGVISLAAHIFALYFWLAYSDAQDLWELGLYLPIRRPAMVGLFLIFWTIGTLTLAIMISRMAKDKDV